MMYLPQYCPEDECSRVTEGTDGSAFSGFLGQQSAFYRSLAAMVRVKFWKYLDSLTETAFSYGDDTAFSSEVLLYQLIEGIKVGARATLELVELTGPCRMAPDRRVEACGMSDQFRAKRSSG